MTRRDRRVVIAVQVQEQHPAGKPARLACGVASLDCQAVLPIPARPATADTTTAPASRAGSSSAVIYASSHNYDNDPRPLSNVAEFYDELYREKVVIGGRTTIRTQRIRDAYPTALLTQLTLRLRAA